MPGPYVKAAFLCEQVIEGKDNVLSFIRVVDKVTHTVIGPVAPADMPPFVHRLKMVVMLVAGDSLGRYDVRVDIRDPSGLSKRGPSLSVEFSQPVSGHNLIGDLELRLEREGPYWIEVFFDASDEPITKIPLQVSYRRAQTSPPLGLSP